MVETSKLNSSEFMNLVISFFKSSIVSLSFSLSFNITFLIFSSVLFLLTNSTSSSLDPTAISEPSSLLQIGMLVPQYLVLEILQSGAVSKTFLNLPSLKYSGIQLISSADFNNWSFSF